MVPLGKEVVRYGTPRPSIRPRTARPNSARARAGGKEQRGEALGAFEALRQICEIQGVLPLVAVVVVVVVVLHATCDYRLVPSLRAQSFCKGLRI